MSFLYLFQFSDRRKLLWFFAVNLTEGAQALPSGDYRADKYLSCLFFNAGVNLLLADETLCFCFVLCLNFWASSSLSVK